LEQILSACGGDLSRLSKSDRVRAVLWFSQSPPECLEGLPAACQRTLARLLQGAGRSDDALLTYGRLLDRYPHHVAAGSAALEAGRLALDRSQTDQARRFLQQALERTLTSEERADAEQLRTRVAAGPRETPAAPLPAEAGVPASAPRRSLTEVLAAFMEDKNILWGEVVGGLLIVGGSIALVISLWNRLQENPYFPFSIFAAITAALFGAGLYTLHHWKLESTSRGLLVIASLLVPLSFLVLPSMLEAEAADNLELLIAGGGFALFAYLLYQAGRVLIPEDGWLLPVAVLGSSAGQILGNRLLVPAEFRPGLLMLLACLPAACQAFSAGWFLHYHGREAELPERRAWSLFALLGMASFALALALGALAFLSHDAVLALRYLAPLIAVAAGPVLAGGVRVHGGLAQVPALAGLRTTGTAVALAAAALMLLAVALAWPQPALVLFVCLLNFLVLTAVAFRAELPVAHAVALPCVAIGYLLAFHLGETYAAPGWPLVVQLFSAHAGTRLAVLTLLLAATGEGLARLGRRPDALAYTAGGGIAALVSLAVVTWHGISTPGHAAVVYGLYAAVSLAVNVRWQRLWVSHIGLALVCGTTLWGLHALWPGRLPLWSAVLAVEGFALAMLPVTSLPLTPEFRRPLAQVAGLIGWLAVGLGISSGLLESWQLAFVVTGAALLGLHLALTVGEQQLQAARAAGVMLVGTVIAAAGWAGTTWAAPDLGALIALCVALSSIGLAAMHLTGAGGRSVLAAAWHEVAAPAALLALFVAVRLSRPETELHTFTAGGLAATAWLLAWRYRAPALTWVGSTLALAGLAHLLSWSAELTTERLAVTVLLLHGSLMLLASLGLRAAGARFRWLFVVPLSLAALVSTGAAAVVLVGFYSGPPESTARYLGWLSVVWLVHAWAEVRRGLFAAFQVALCLSVVYALTAELEGEAWDPFNLQVYGLGLAGLCFLWVVARILLQSNPTAQRLLLPDWPGVDRLVLGGLLWVVLMGLADVSILGGVLNELTPAGWEVPLAFLPRVFLPIAWALWAALLIVVTASLWQPAPPRRQTEAVLGLVVLAVAATVLRAETFATTEQNAAASALRWGLALAFLFCSALLWLRRPLAAVARTLGMPTDSAMAGRVRLWLLDLVFLPVLLLTGTVVVLVLAGLSPSGPAAESVFRKLGGPVSLLVPVGLLSLTLVGHSLRERSAGYACSAGLLVIALVVGGDALAVVRGGQEFGSRDWVRLLQLGAGTAAVWSVLWLAFRQYATTWREGAGEWRSSAYLGAHAALSIAASGVLLLGAAAVVIATALDPAGPAAWHRPALAWTMQTGSLLGWVTLGLTGTAVYAWRQWSLSRREVLTLAFAAVVLAACSAEYLVPGWGFRILLAGWAAFALGCVMASRGETAGLAAPFWIALTALLVVSLGTTAAAVRGDHLWSAAAIAIVSAAAFLLAGQRRRADWALASGLGFNLAAALVLWHLHADEPIRDWWVRLVQVNALASAAVALVWLGWRARRADEVALVPTWRDLLTVQVALGLLPCAFLLGLAFLLLYLRPGGPMAWETIQAGQAAGWLGLVLAATAAVWHLRQAAPTSLTHLFGGCGVLVAFQVAAMAAAWDGGAWLAYHVLLVALVAAAALMLTAGWVAAEAKLLGPVYWPEERRAAAARLLALCFPSGKAQRWVEGLGILLVGLALRGSLEDPAAPYWPAGTVLAVSLLAAGLAFWSGRPYFAHISGSLVFLAGVLAWVAWGGGELETFLGASILCLGIASAVWSPLEVHLRRRARGEGDHWSVWSVTLLLAVVVLVVLFGRGFLAWGLLTTGGLRAVTALCLPAAFLAIAVLVRLSHLAEVRSGRANEEERLASETASRLPFSQAAGLLGVNLLAVLIALGLSSDLTANGIRLNAALAWTALGVTLLAGLVRLWDAEGIGRGLRTLAPYVTALLGLGLALHGLALEPARLGWALGLSLSGCILLTAAASWSVPRLGWLRQRLRLPAPPGPGLEPWLLPVQAGLTVLAVALSVWMSFSFAHRLDRLAGPLAAALLVPAWVLWTRLRELGVVSPTWQLGGLRHGALLLGVLPLAEAAWALPDPAAAGAWLHRDVLLFGALAVMAVGYTLGLRWLPPRLERWAEAGARLGPRLGLAAVLVVLVVLGQEVAQFEPALRKTPMAPWALALVALALAALATASVIFALRPQADPLALPERRRPLYIYGAELLLVLLFLHVRLTLPEMFRGVLGQYWTLVVMFLAFLGVGLAELFERRRLHVLAEPLQRTGVFLPLLPLLAFWLQVLAGPFVQTTGEMLPGLQPLLNYLRRPAERGPPDFANHAAIWFLLGLLYVLVAVTRRSARFALLAALAANFGLWALFYHYRAYDLSFVVHPQLWLVPLALIVLAAEHVNRDRLPAGQATALRYFGLIALYVSSTADLFLAGLGDVGLSLVLAVLSVLGVLAGIQLRVRAFLFVGLSFLVLVIFARIWHAAVMQAQTWVWWVALIVLGAAILTLFAIFEKRRNEVLKMLEELKRWR
jgi:hypothetical protein